VLLLPRAESVMALNPAVVRTRCRELFVASRLVVDWEAADCRP
jgi:hypothetical protein